MIYHIMGKTKLEREYKLKYGNLPDSQEELLEYIRETYNVNMDKVNKEIERINSIQWKEVFVSLNIVPKPSPRPRTGGGHFYVKGAKEHKRYMESIIDERNIICTKTELSIVTYHPIPISSMTSTEIYLAQLGILDHISNPDWDNLGKTYSDMIQGLLLLNDNIVNPGIVSKKYSLKPHVDIRIRYQDGFDSKFNERRVVTSKKYKEYSELGIITRGE